MPPKNNATIAAQESPSAPLRTPNWRIYDDDAGLSPVLDAALEVFTDLGYHGTTVRIIARQATLSVPGLYYHFTSKQEILAALLRHSNDDIMGRARAALEEGADSPRTRFMLQVENIILYMTHRRRLAHLAREIKFLEEPYRQQHIARRDELETIMRRDVEAARKQGHFRTTDAHEATRAVWVLCRGVADWYVKKGPKTPAQIAATYVGYSLALVGDRQKRPA